MSDLYCIEQNKKSIIKGLACKGQGNMKGRYMHMPSLSMIVLKSRGGQYTDCLVVSQYFLGTDQDSQNTALP